MKRSIVAASALLLAAGQASAGALPSVTASKSIKYTDEPDPAIYAAAQASAAAIAYGPSVLKGQPSGGRLLQPSSLEAQNVPEEVPAETPANPAAAGGGYGEEAAPSAASVVADPAAAAAAGGYGTEKTTTEAAPSVDTTTTSSPVSGGEGADTVEATAETTPETTTAAAPSVDTTTTSPDSSEGADTTTPLEDSAQQIEKPSTPTSPSDDSSTVEGTTANAPVGDVTSSDTPAHSASEEQTPEAFSDVNRRLRRYM